MSLLHDRELADTLEDEAARRIRSHGPSAYVERLRRDARELRARIVKAERRMSRDLEGRAK